MRREIFVGRRIEIYLTFVTIQRENRDIGGIGAFSKRNCQNIDFDYDALAKTLRRGRSSSKRKLHKLLRGQVDNMRSFLDSLAEVEDMYDCYFRELIPSFLLQRLPQTQDTQVDFLAFLTKNCWIACMLSRILRAHVMVSLWKSFFALMLVRLLLRLMLLTCHGSWGFFSTLCAVC